jgi:hypothetical protein
VEEGAKETALIFLTRTYSSIFHSDGCCYGFDCDGDLEFVLSETVLPQLYISVYRIPRRSASTLFIFVAATFNYTRAGATCFKSQ